MNDKLVQVSTDQRSELTEKWPVISEESFACESRESNVSDIKRI